MDYHAPPRPGGKRSVQLRDRGRAVAPDQSRP